MRRFSVLEMNQRRFFTSLKTLDLVTSLRKRLNKLSCDSPDLNSTFAIRFVTSFPIEYDLIFRRSFVTPQSMFCTTDLTE
jgi:hypothetical protein